LIWVLVYDMYQLEGSHSQNCHIVSVLLWPCQKLAFKAQHKWCCGDKDLSSTMMKMKMKACSSISLFDSIQLD